MGHEAVFVPEGSSPESRGLAGDRREGREALETPRVFVFEGDPEKPLVGVTLKDPGGTNFLLPVISVLMKAGYPLCLYTTGYTKKNFPFENGFVEADPAQAYAISPRVVVRTCADRKNNALPSTPENLESRWSQAVFIDVEDYPGSSQTIPGRAPEYLCVINDAAKALQEERRPAMDQDKIITTGSPAFDRYSKITSKERKSLREEARMALSVSKQEFVVLFSGQNPPATPIALRQTVAALNALTTRKNVVLVFSRHPRDITTDYTSALSEFKGRVIVQSEIIHSDTGKPITSEMVGWGADLLVSSHSTEALHSMYRGVPTLHIAFHHSIRNIPGYLQFEQPPLPVRAGASFWIPDGDDVAQAAVVFKKAIDSKVARRNKLRAAKDAVRVNGKNPDGRSAERVAQVIMNAALA